MADKTGKRRTAGRGKMANEIEKAYNISKRWKSYWSAAFTQMVKMWSSQICKPRANINKTRQQTCYKCSDAALPHLCVVNKNWRRKKKWKTRHLDRKPLKNVYEMVDTSKSSYVNVIEIGLASNEEEHWGQLRHTVATTQKGSSSDILQNMKLLGYLK